MIEWYRHTALSLLPNYGKTNRNQPNLIRIDKCRTRRRKIRGSNHSGKRRHTRARSTTWVL
jgi:hypothetical protein